MTTLPTFAECAAVPPEKRTALERFIREWTRPHAVSIGGLRGALLAVIKEERKERDALAAALEDTRKVRDEWCDEYTKARDERDAYVERSVGAMAIADGEEGYEKVPIDCPMLAAVSELRSKYNALRAENERLRAALSWYADESNYGTRVCNDGDGHFDVIEADAEEDRGERARAALAKEPTT